MPLAPPLSSREVRRTSKEALEAVQSLGAVVNGNATLLNEFGQRLKALTDDVRHAMADQQAQAVNLASITHDVLQLPLSGSTVWQRLRWLVRGT